MSPAGRKHGRPGWPVIRAVGIDGFLVSFDDRLSDAANRAALACRAALDAARLPGVEETSTSLASAYVRFDPTETEPDALRGALAAFVGGRDWYRAPLPAGRRLWRIPTVFGGDRGPQLGEAAALAGISEDAAVASIAGTRLRVETIGFAPGQPYLGHLPPCWDIPRQTDLTPRVPVGALTVAIRQLVLFTVSSPTGWRHIGQTAFRAFRPEAERPFVLSPGDEVIFEPVAGAEFQRLETSGADGGATSEDLP
ncbi:MAG: carboxyltransferase domain-containing protein [Paracoccaceae bacterium]|nr:carboxyltransferase domain-containing protein [Paracoccaceae bacterium]